MGARVAELHACCAVDGGPGAGNGAAGAMRPLWSSMAASGDSLDQLAGGGGVLRRVLSEGFLLIRLAFRLLAYLGVGYKWFLQLVRLVLYAVLLLPGFIQMIVFYFFSSRVVRSVAYGCKSRQCLDLYFPPKRLRSGAHPFVIYVTGGAWTIGYKAWGALLASRISEQGVLVACLDYRNFPQGDALDMLEDVNTGISWVLRHAHRYGGDPERVTLVGQSAGGHLAGLALIKQAEQAALGQPVLGASPEWSPTCVRAFVGVSGAFDLRALAEHLHRRGLYKSLVERIMSLPTANDSSNEDYDYANGDGPIRLPNGLYADVTKAKGTAATPHDASGCKGRARPAYGALSPLEAAQRLPPAAAALLPRVLLIHGTADKTVPAAGSARLCEALTAAGARSCRCLLVPGKTHTAFLLEDPMRGGRDLLSDTVLAAAVGPNGGGGEEEWGEQQQAGPPGQYHVYRTLCPGWLCDLAGWVCPF